MHEVQVARVPQIPAGCGKSDRRVRLKCSTGATSASASLRYSEGSSGQPKRGWEGNSKRDEL